MAPRHPRPAPDADPPPLVDLHGLTRAQARRRALQELHAARVRGVTRLVLITGRGTGSRTGAALLRDELEALLRSAEGRALGVVQVARAHRGGALEVALRPPAPPAQR